MKYFLLLLFVSPCFAVEIPDEMLRECLLEGGGCVITLPDGKIYKMNAINDQIRELIKQAYIKGKEDTEKTCRKSV